MARFKIGENPKTFGEKLMGVSVTALLTVGLVFGIKTLTSIALNHVPTVATLFFEAYPTFESNARRFLIEAISWLSLALDIIIVLTAVLLIGTISYLIRSWTFEQRVVMGLKKQFADGTTTNVLGLQPNAVVPTPKVTEVEKDGKVKVSVVVNIPIKGSFDPDNVPIRPLSSSVPKSFIVESRATSENQNHMILKLRNTKYSRRIVANNIDDLLLVNEHTFSLMKGVHWDVLKAPHAVISGVTGSGKSYFVYSLVYQALKMNAEVIIIDPKSDDLSTLGDSVSAVAITPEEALDTLENVVKRLYQRQEKIRLKKLVAKKPQDVSALSIGERPIIVFIDELAALQAAVSEDRQKSQKLEALLKTITLLGRSSMINIVFILQQANAKNIPTEAREQAGLKVLLGNSTAETRRFLLPGQDLAATDFPRQSGKGYYMLDGVTKGAAELIETPTINFNIFDEISRLRR